MISAQELAEIRDKADVVEVISNYVSLKRQGKNYTCFCPFHNDKNHPSMVVSPEKQIFNCFSCKNGGDVFAFVSKYENIPYYEAVKLIAKQVGVNLSGVKNENNVLKKYSHQYELMDKSMKYYLNNINTKAGQDAKNYLINRGINEETIKDFSIGLSLNKKNDLINFLKSFDYTEKDIELLGLANLYGVDYFDSFKNRIMIPITNINNDVVGFTGRIFNGEDEAKYINTKETIIFKKGNILFNYYNAKKYIRELKQIIIVEGNMDAIKMHSSGIKNVVALMGTFISTNQLDILRKTNSEIILLLDNDEAGYNATIKNGDYLLENGITASVIRLSDAKDPDEYIHKFGVEALKNNLIKPINYIDFKINDLKKIHDINSSVGVSSLIKNIKNILNHLDNITKSVIVNKLCNELNLDRSIFEDIKEPVIIPEKQYVPEIKSKKNKYTVLANKVLFYIMNNPKYLKIYKNELNFFQTKIERDLAFEIETFYNDNKNLKFADFLGYIMQKEYLNELINDIISGNAGEELVEEVFLEYLVLLKKKIIEDDIQRLKYQAKIELDVDKKLKLIEQLTRLKKGSVDNE